MGQLSGTLRGAALDLRADPAIDVHATPDITVAVLHHTAAALTARELLDSYQQRGLRAIEQRADDCAVVVFDRNARTLILARDFAGVTPLYYGTNAREFAFGTRATDVTSGLGVAARPDVPSLARLLIYHQGPLPGRTCFENVNAVPAGHLLVTQNEHVEVRGSPVRIAVRAWSFEDAVTEFGRLLQQAIMRRSQGDVCAVTVSGGLDSAALVCLAARADTPVIGINYGAPEHARADETRYLDALRSAGITIESVPFFPSIDVASAEQSVRESELPAIEMVPLTLARAAHAARDLGAMTIMTGIWGDQVLAPFPPRHERSLVPWRISRLAHAYHDYLTDVPFREIRTAFRRQALRGIAPQWLLQRRRKRLRERSIFDTLALSNAGPGPIEHIRSYPEAVYQSVFAPGAQQGVESAAKWATANGVVAGLPFLDRDLLQFLMTLPDEVAYHGHALKPLLRASMRGIVPAEVLARRDKGDYTQPMRSRSITVATAIELLDGLRRPVDWGLMSRARARKALARTDYDSNIWDGSAELATLLGLDIWLRLFLGK